MHQDVIAIDDLYDHIEGWWRLTLQHAFLRAASSRLVITERHRLNPADQVGQRWVQHQVVEAIAVGGTNELHSALGNGSCSDRLRLGADLIDHDHLRHMVLNRLNHHQVLALGCAHLHATRLANRWMRNVTVAGDLVRGVHHYNPLAEL